MKGPLRDTYWVVDGLLLAGRYAGDYDDVIARERICALLDAGIRVFIDLTERGELPSYAEVLREEADARGVRADYVRAPIQDLGVPAEADLGRLLATIDETLTSKRAVYVHCHGGIGRTGTVIGCWLAQSGYPGEQALERIAALRLECPGAWGPSPETETQRDMVRKWRL